MSIRDRVARFTAGQRIQGKGLPFLLAVLGLGFFLHLPTLDDAFHGDDFVAFKEFGRKSVWEYSRDAFLFKDTNFYWRPLGVILHRLLYEGFGFDPLPYRLAGLGFFLATLAAVFAFCLRERLGVAVAAGAALLLAVFPNHVVSVAWVTNTSRLMAVLFVLLALLALQSKPTRYVAPFAELLALLFFLAAALSDETSMALAPVLVLYGAFLRDSRWRRRSALLRAAAYGLILFVLLPLQFEKTIDDEPRLSFYGFGPHILTQAWALTSQLVLPLTPATPIDIYLATITPLQWAAGLTAIAAGMLLLLFGSGRLRLLLVWTAAALAPFTLWDLNYTSPRYVYMAAVPFAIIAAWMLVSGYHAIAPLLTRLGATAVALRPAAALATASMVLLAVYTFGRESMARNEAWSEETERYGVLAEGLKRELPSPPPGARIVVFYSPMPDFWASAVVQSIYADPSLRVTGISWERATQGSPPLRSDDLVFYLLGDKLMPASPSLAQH